MLLFAFSLVLAGAAVAVAALIGVRADLLQQMLMLSVAVVLGSAGLVGLFIALLDRMRNQKRNAKVQELQEAPSALDWRPPHAPATPAYDAAPSDLPEAQAHEPAQVAPPITSDEETPLAPSRVDASPAVEADVPKSTPEALAPSHTNDVAPGAVQENLRTLDDIAPAPHALTSTPEVQAPLVEEAPIAQEAPPLREPADQQLHLDPEFELSEVKRVLRIWQMTFNEELPHDQMASWSAADGTQIDLVNSAKGYPILEIRGPMASELAEFLPQDLPVHPEAPHE